jgi:hypothetical protein
MEKKTITEKLNEFLDELAHDEHTIKVLQTGPNETTIWYEHYEHPPIRNHNSCKDPRVRAKCLPESMESFISRSQAQYLARGMSYKKNSGRNYEKVSRN